MYDAVVVGARVAGAPTAMLLARHGYEVLCVDRTTFPSDTMSTHAVKRQGVAALARWGLLDRVLGTGAPPFRDMHFEAGPHVLEGHAPAVGGVDITIAPKRTVLDALLVQAASEAGAEIRESFRVDDLLFDDGRVAGVRGRDADGNVVEERARVTIGADGLRSFVARATGARPYVDRPPLTYFQYAYWEGLNDDELGIYLLPRGIAITFPTNDASAILAVAVPVEDAARFRHDLEGEYLAAANEVPRLAARLRDARRVSRFVGTADLPNFVRQAHGPGWALVGDARAHRDPIIAEGIACAFRDAEALAAALHDAFRDAAPVDDALARYQAQRDAESMPWFELTCQLASFDLPRELQALLGALPGNQDAIDDFFGVIEGTTSPAEFFAPERVAALLG